MRLTHNPVGYLACGATDSSARNQTDVEVDKCPSPSVMLRAHGVTAEFHRMLPDVAISRATARWVALPRANNRGAPIVIGPVESNGAAQ